MKKLLCAMLVLVLLTAVCAQAEHMQAEPILTANGISAAAACLIDAATGTVLYEKNADAAMYPASTTKIMTCLLAIENGKLDKEITIPKEAADVPKDSSVVPVTVGERMTMRDLLYGFMLMSGNDAANAIAVLVDGSIPEFVRHMNTRARELGMTNTHFVNAHGYHEENHYTTARDLVTLARFAMQNEDFRTIVGTAGYEMPPTNKREKKLKVITTNEMKLRSSEYYDERVTGIKTGYTKQAGRCLVFSGMQNGIELIGVVMKSGTDKDSPKCWKDTSKLLDYGYGRYRRYTFSELYALQPAVAYVSGAAPGDGGELRLELANVSGDCPVWALDGKKDDALARMRENTSYVLTMDLVAPISEGSIVGTLLYTVPSGQTISASLVATRSVPAVPEGTGTTLDPFDWGGAGKIIGIAALVIVALLIVRSAAAKRRRRKKRKRGSGTYYRQNRDRYN